MEKVKRWEVEVYQIQIFEPHRKHCLQCCSLFIMRIFPSPCSTLCYASLDGSGVEEAFENSNRGSWSWGEHSSLGSPLNEPHVISATLPCLAETETG
jgi:hypothetical protein